LYGSRLISGKALSRVYENKWLIEMKPSKTGKFIRAISITCFCILIAVQSFAHVLPHGFANDIQQSKVETMQNPCNDCPCDDQHGERECDIACSCCSGIASLPENVIFRFSSIVTIVSPSEPLLQIPQVYLPIFVPPQNCSWT
jgi:hypothetical protein